MIKRYCDCCSKEIPQGRTGNAFSYLCHIDGILDGNAGYVDSDGNAISGRTVTKDLCPACYNRVMAEAVKMCRSISEKNSFNR